MAEGSIGISLYDTGMLRVEEIAGQLKAAWEGQGDLEITGVAPLESAGASDIAFVGNRKAAADATRSHAPCCIPDASWARMASVSYAPETTMRSFPRLGASRSATMWKSVPIRASIAPR